MLWKSLFEELKKQFHGANVVLFLLISLTVFHSIWQIQSKVSSTEQNIEIEFRVLDRKVDLFNRFVYYVFFDGGVWEMGSPTLLNFGYKYLGLGTLSRFDFSANTDTFDKTALSLGVVGEIKLHKLIAQSTTCDLMCQTLKITQEARKYTAQTYLSASCKSFGFLVKVFAPKSNCEDVFALSFGLVLGGTDKFSRELYGQIRQLGLTHLVAVSGFQVILVISFLEFLALKGRLPRKIRLMLAILGVILLIMLAGPQPPILRSFLSVFLSLSILIFLGRKLDSLRALTYSGLILLWINPFYLVSVSFQLSFLASFGLILGNTQTNTETSVNWVKNFRELVVSCLATFLTTLPVVLMISGRVTMLAVITNILILPFIPVISLLNVAGLVPVLGQIPLAIAIIMQSMVITFVQELSSLSLADWLAIEQNQITWQFLVMYYSFLLVLAFWWKKQAQKDDSIPK